MDRMWEKREWWENGTHNTSLCIVRLLGQSCNQADTAAATCSSSGRRVHTSFLSPYTLSTRPVPHSNHLTQIRFSKPKKKLSQKTKCVINLSWMVLYLWWARTSKSGAMGQGKQRTLGNTAFSMCLPLAMMEDVELPENTNNHQNLHINFSKQYYLSNKIFVLVFLNTLRTLFWTSAFPFSICAISSLIEMRASQNLSNSACKRIFLVPSSWYIERKKRVSERFAYPYIPCFHSLLAQS